MIRLNDQIRLTRKEIEVFTKITDIEPVGIRTLDDLEAYVARCKAHYWGGGGTNRVCPLADRPGIPAVSPGRMAMATGWSCKSAPLYSVTKMSLPRPEGQGRFHGA